MLVLGSVSAVMTIVHKKYSVFRISKDQRWGRKTEIFGGIYAGSMCTMC